MTTATESAPASKLTLRARPQAEIAGVKAQRVC